jgi:hypothetical protein
MPPMNRAFCGTDTKFSAINIPQLWYYLCFKKIFWQYLLYVWLQLTTPKLGELISRDCALQISFFLFASGPLVSGGPDATIGFAYSVLIIGWEWDPTHFSPLQKCLHVALFTSFQAFYLTKIWLMFRSVVLDCMTSNDVMVLVLILRVPT